MGVADHRAYTSALVPANPIERLSRKLRVTPAMPGRECSPVQPGQGVTHREGQDDSRRSVHYTIYSLLSRHLTIREIDASAWNCLAGKNVFAAHGFLLTVESCYRAPMEPVYFTLFRDRLMVAAAVCHVARAARETETLDDMVFGQAALGARALGLTFLPAFICGPPVGYGWHIGVHPDLGPRDAAEARVLMLDAMDAEARARRLRVSFTQVLDAEVEARRLVETRRYLRCKGVPVAALDLPFASFDEYLESLPRAIRREIRRQIRRNGESGTTIGLLDEVGDAEGRLQALVDGNFRKYNGRPFALGRGFFAALRGAMGDHARIFVARKAGSITGVCLVLVQQDAAFPIAVGVDPEMASDDFTYFQVAYHAPIAHAIATGIRQMFYGRGMETMKMRRGCRFMGAWLYYQPSVARRPLAVAWFAAVSAWINLKSPSTVRRSVEAGRS